MRKSKWLRNVLLCIGGVFLFLAGIGLGWIRCRQTETAFWENTVSPGGRFTAWYEDDDMFWGHVITVDGTLKKGPVDADIQG